MHVAATIHRRPPRITYVPNMKLLCLILWQGEVCTDDLFFKEQNSIYITMYYDANTDTNAGRRRRTKYDCIMLYG